jgi:hypothetical protein
VYRVAPEHVRTLSEREALQFGSHLATGPIDDLPRDAGKGVFQYEDLTEVVNPLPVAETAIEATPGNMVPTIPLESQLNQSPATLTMQFPQ